MGFHVPYRLRPFRRDPGCHTFPFVTWALVVIVALAIGLLIASVGYVALVTVH